MYVGELFLWTGGIFLSSSTSFDCPILLSFFLFLLQTNFRDRITKHLRIRLWWPIMGILTKFNR